MVMKGWAVITGASAGLGVEFARQLARRGFDLVLVARRKERLDELAREIEKDTGRKTIVIASDLGVRGAAKELVRDLDARGVEVALLVNNAGVGMHGPAIEQSIEKTTQMIELNVVALTELCLAIGRAMAERGAGAILNVSSTASFQPNPYFAAYGATKAFVTSFSAALAYELRGRGVRVLASCPGPTKTEFNEAGNVRIDVGDWVYMSAARCVRISLDALERGRWVKVTGFFNAIGAFLSRRSPLWLVTRITGLVMRPSRRALPPAA